MKIYGISYPQGTNDQIMLKGGSEGGRRYTNTFPSNLKTINLNISSSYGRMLKEKP